MTPQTDRDERAQTDRLARSIEGDQAALLAAWRLRVAQLPSARRLDTPTLNDHVPRLLAELAAALRADASPPLLPPHDDRKAPTPTEHGLQRLDVGLDIEEVVAEYGALRRCIVERAEAEGIVLRGAPLRLLNQLLDNAIGQAIRGYAAQQALDVQKRREDYLAVVAHGLRAPLHSVSLATDVLETAAASPGTGIDPARTVPMLRRNVQRLNDLVADVLRENQSAGSPAAGQPRTAQVALAPLVTALLTECAPGSAAHEVPAGLQIEADPWLVEKLLRALVGRARAADGARLRVHGEPASPGPGVALRFELTWPPSRAEAATRPRVWPLPCDPAGAAGDDHDAGLALKTLVDTNAATVHAEALSDGEALVLIWPAPPPA